MTYIVKPQFHHPSLSTNKLGFTRRDYEGRVSTLCAGCGHDSISAAKVISITAGVTYTLGWFCQTLDGATKRASLPKGWAPDSLTLDRALMLLNLRVHVIRLYKSDQHKSVHHLLLHEQDLVQIAPLLP